MHDRALQIGDWGLGIGDWGSGKNLWLVLDGLDLTGIGWNRQD